MRHAYANAAIVIKDFSCPSPAGQSIDKASFTALLKPSSPYRCERLATMICIAKSMLDPKKERRKE
jgi:hypothetical protein